MRLDQLLRSPHSKRGRRAASGRPRKLSNELLESRLLLAQTTGLFYNDPNASDGYVLMSPNSDLETRLIDKEGNLIHQWDFGTTPGLLAYLQPDGSLVRASSAGIEGVGGNGTISAAGAGGRIEWVEWDGTPRWSFDYGISDTAPDSTTHLQHHDIEVMPNGHILMIAWELKTGAEAITAGRTLGTVGDELYPDHIVEVDPTNAVTPIAWEWHIWDHLGAGDPGKIDINYVSESLEGGGALEDWTHSNGIDYNAELDQILLSVREFSEFWIIDHNTTTTEAAGAAGDLLYRWGNPQTYGAGVAGDRQLFFQHDAKWVTDDSPGAGNITVFNNGYFGPADPDLSMAVEITPPVDEFGNYPTLGAGEAYGPAVPTWTYTLAEDDFSHIISGTQRLANGNTLITSGIDGTFLEVTPAGAEVWRYVNPYVGDAFAVGGVLGPMDPIPPFPALGLSSNFVFRAIHYPADYAPQFETAVFGRHLFYDNSKFDREGITNKPGINPEDSLAIATDKTAYLPGGGLIGTVNMSAYSRGINGVMVDIGNPAGTLGLGDFDFKMSEQGFTANNTPSSWTAAPAPSAFTVLTDTPSPGTDRVEFIWADNAIEKRYLEVTVKGNDAAGGFNINTGLAATDYFYYGSQVGDDFLGTGAVSFITSGFDETDARANQGFGQPLTNIYDYDKDGIVSGADQIVARSNGSFLARINITGPPPPAPAAGDDGSGSAVASALAEGAVSSAAPDVAAVIDRAVATRAPASAPARRFWQLLGEASDPRASVLLGSLDEVIETFELGEWPNGGREL